ncbi:hypothetical protein [Methanoregula sp.]|uniref:hypothetical protein n=1 Tax=Methanoregula sp. TaxID=2052170 RepID=UPI00236D1F3E|nr:hypothetical protein [Methanoregula sp.]MDD1686267.1 hypothetical protein [Methanoregula sp.]
MASDTGTLSIDFLAGFTIFMLAFIWVATMIPGLFLGIRANTIDYDAVAYRTGVILVEDPGAAGTVAFGGPQGKFPWELQSEKVDVARFGLAVSRETPNILDRNKIDRFFCTTAFTYPDDYHAKAIFGDYPYRFNISLKYEGQEQVQSVGEPIPDNYGYIRRDVKVKQGSNATIDKAVIKEFKYNNTDTASRHDFSIVLNNTRLLYEEVRDPAYRISTPTDRIMINITDLDETRSNKNVPAKSTGLPSGYNLSAVTFSYLPLGQASRIPFTPPAKYAAFVYEDGNATPVSPPVDVRNNVTLVFEPGFFKNINTNSQIYINLTFGLRSEDTFLNNTLTSPYDYNYTATHLTSPSLHDGVLEVAVW